MATVIALVLACYTLVAAGVALTQASYNWWRLQKPDVEHRMPSEGTMYGTLAEIVAKAALVVIEVITILYLSVGFTPVDGLIALGLHVPTTLNKYLLTYGMQLQVIVGTHAFMGLNHSIKACHFPRYGEGAERRNAVAVNEEPEEG